MNESSDLKVHVDTDVTLNVKFLKLSSDLTFHLRQEKLTNLRCLPVTSK